MTGITNRQASVMKSRSGELQNRHDGSFAWKTAVSLIRNLPGLRGAWTMGSLDENGDQFDLSGQARTLNYNGGSYISDGLIPAISLGGATWMNRADEAGLDILGTEAYITDKGLTIGGWFRFDRLTNSEFLIGKASTVAATSSYWLSFRGDVANDPVRFNVSDGAALDTVDVQITPAVDTWAFVCGRYDPSTEIKVWAAQGTLENNTNAVGIPAALANTAVDFTVGADSTGAANFLQGDVSLCFLCAVRLSDAMIAAIWHHTRAMYGG